MTKLRSTATLAVLAILVCASGCRINDSLNRTINRNMFNQNVRECVAQRNGTCCAVGNDYAGRSARSHLSVWSEDRNLKSAKQAYTVGCANGETYCCQRLLQLGLTTDPDQIDRYRRLIAYGDADEFTAADLAEEDRRIAIANQATERGLEKARAEENAAAWDVVQKAAGATLQASQQISNSIATGKASPGFVYSDDPEKNASLQAQVKQLQTGDAPGNAEIAQMKKNIKSTVATYDAEMAEKKATQEKKKEAAEAAFAKKKQELLAEQQAQEKKDAAERQRRLDEERRKEAQRREDERKSALAACLGRIAPETIPERGDGFGPAITAVHSAQSQAEQCADWKSCQGAIQSRLANYKEWTRQCKSVEKLIATLPAVDKPDCSLDTEKVADMDFWCWDIGATAPRCADWLRQAGSALECAAQLFHWGHKEQAVVDYEAYKKDYVARCNAQFGGS